VAAQDSARWSLDVRTDERTRAKIQTASTTLWDRQWQIDVAFACETHLTARRLRGTATISNANGSAPTSEVRPFGTGDGLVQYNEYGALKRYFHRTEDAKINLISGLSDALGHQSFTYVSFDGTSLDSISYTLTASLFDFRMVRTRLDPAGDSVVVRIFPYAEMLRDVLSACQEDREMRRHPPPAPRFIISPK
jgi:hypothetical protein